MQGRGDNVVQEMNTLITATYRQSNKLSPIELAGPPQSPPHRGNLGALECNLTQARKPYGVGTLTALNHTPRPASSRCTLAGSLVQAVASQAGEAPGRPRASRNVCTARVSGDTAHSAPSGTFSCAASFAACAPQRRYVWHQKVLCCTTCNACPVSGITVSLHSTQRNTAAME